MNAPVVAVIGAGEADASQDLAAEAVGAALAREGATFGTLSEIAFARKLGRPVVGLATWSATSPSESEPLVHVAADAETAVRMALWMVVLADSAEDG